MVAIFPFCFLTDWPRTGFVRLTIVLFCENMLIVIDRNVGLAPVKRDPETSNRFALRRPYSRVRMSYCHGLIHFSRVLFGYPSPRRLLLSVTWTWDWILQAFAQCSLFRLVKRFQNCTHQTFPYFGSQAGRKFSRPDPFAPNGPRARIFTWALLHAEK